MLNLPEMMAVKSAKFSAFESIKHESDVLFEIKGCPFVIERSGEETTAIDKGDVVLVPKWPAVLPLPTPAKPRLEQPRVSPEIAANPAVFPEFSNHSFSLISPPNLTSKGSPILGSRFRPLPVSFWDRSKNKSGSK
ncbi:hypothetical protein L3X38_017483 [Prunus dulcis]|uniref:Uncharacterized protein n=1 Tax=Prunus dulcis TaxID=3755 RepID=A0AAD4Z970_PRUDU|nr:hypothetical protein L3X38_017483 [Prunus dulcis]